MRFVSILFLCGVLVTPLAAQEVEFLACPAVSFVGPACVEVLPYQVAPVVVPQAAFQPEPLFTKDTVARDTPPVMLRMFNDPNPANVRAAVAFHRKKLDQGLLAQRLFTQEMMRQLGGKP